MAEQTKGHPLCLSVFRWAQPTLLVARYLRNVRFRFSPVHRIATLLDEAMKCGIGPLRWGFDQSMFHGIEVDIVAVRGIIGFAPNAVFPETSLPNPGFPFGSLWIPG